MELGSSSFEGTYMENDGLADKAIFFDIGNTFMYADPPVPEVFTRVANRLGHFVALSDAEGIMDEVNAFYQSEYLRDGDFWCDHDRAVQIWLDIYTFMARYCGITHDVDILTQAVYDEYLLPECWSLFPDVERTLKGLKERGYRLGVISNWDASLEDLLRSMGYLPYFDEVIASAAVGTRKPYRAIFDIALERMGVSAQNALHVGDLPEADGQGAASAGIRPIIIDRHGRHADCPYERIEVLTDLLELPGL